MDAHTQLIEPTIDTESSAVMAPPNREADLLELEEVELRLRAVALKRRLLASAPPGVTGGGAFLEFLEGKVLPAVEILEQRAQ